MFLKKSQIFIFLVLIFSGHATVSAGIRCGNDIISPGDTKTLVAGKLQSCGDILDRDSYVKETTTTASETETTTGSQKIDIWSIRITERGNSYCYPLTFEDGLLTEIGSWSRCN